MNKKILGICIPYYKNSEECEIRFKALMECLVPQLTNNMILCIYEDGQFSNWLFDKVKDNENILVMSNKENKGVSYARNRCIDYLIPRVEYILFIDSDDMVDQNYLKIMCEYCSKNKYEVVESTFYVNEVKAAYNVNLIRSGVIGSAIKTDIIGNKRFNEKLQITEDTTFMNKVIDLSIHKKVNALINYIYQYGVNKNSLIMRFNRKEIRKER